MPDFYSYASIGMKGPSPPRFAAKRGMSASGADPLYLYDVFPVQGQCSVTHLRMECSELLMSDQEEIRERRGMFVMGVSQEQKAA